MKNTILTVILGLCLLLLIAWVFTLRNYAGKASAIIEKQTAAIATLQAEIVELKKEASLKSLPIKITHRAALTGSGGVLQIENRSDAPIALKLRASRGSDSHTFDLVINPNVTSNTGYGEGWAFVAGDQIEISSDGYKPLRGKYSDK